MSDYASIMGGNAPDTVVGSQTGLDQVGNDWAAYYHIESAGVFLDRFGSSGDSLVDATGNTGGARIEVGSGSDSIYAGSGADSIWGGAGNDTIIGGRGDDTAQAGVDGANTISGASGDDLVVGGTGNDNLAGGEGADTLRGGLGDDSVVGGSGADSLRGDAGDDTVFGGSGADSLYGMAGDDELVGGSGADLLLGGAGNDTLFGGSGGDVFAFDNGFGQDVISDFRQGDQINLAADLNGSGIQDAADLVSMGMVTGGTTAAGTDFTLITIGADTIRLENVDAADFINGISTFVKVG